MTVKDFLDRTHHLGENVKLLAYDMTNFGYETVVVNHDTESVNLFDTDDFDTVRDLGDFRREVSEACLDYTLFDNGTCEEVDNIIFGSFSGELVIYLVSA